MNIEEKRDIEKRKYIILDDTNYGDTFHGEIFLKNNSVFKEKNIKSVLDVGTGKGNAVHYMNSIGINTKGVDFAIKPDKSFDQTKFITSYAHNIPVKDKSFDCITSFDVVEHCLEEDIDLIFEEFNRIAKKLLVLSICFNKSTIKQRLIDNNMNGQLHPTVKPYEWWYDKIKKFGVIKKQHGYFICYLK
jgi:ubiquinone/menaquinone biosynthesis C-methylase UbiE